MNFDLIVTFVHFYLLWKFFSGCESTGLEGRKRVCRLRTGHQTPCRSRPHSFLLGHTYIYVNLSF